MEGFGDFSTGLGNLATSNPELFFILALFALLTFIGLKVVPALFKSLVETQNANHQAVLTRLEAHQTESTEARRALHSKIDKINDKLDRDYVRKDIFDLHKVSLDEKFRIMQSALEENATIHSKLAERKENDRH